MKIGIMQPYFLPYIGYFQLINAVDKYVIYDDVNYIKQGWVNRNRILLDGESYMFSIQLTGASSFKKINEIGLGNNTAKVFKTIQQAYFKAPFYNEVIDSLYKIFNFETANLAEFVTNSIREICSYLNIHTEILISSHIEKDNLLKGEDKVIQICKLFNADTYINAIGGQSLYDKQHFHNDGIQLLFLNTNNILYNQFSSKFVQNLSILDVLMFNSPREISGMLFQYDLITNGNSSHK